MLAINLLELLTHSGLCQKLSKSALIVTGGSSGMGKAVLDALNSFFPNENIVNLDLRAGFDVTDPASIRSALSKLDTRQDLEDIYVFSNAGLEVFFTSEGKHIDFLDDAYDINKIIGVNLTSHILLVRELIKFANQRNCIRNINLVINSSIAAFCIGGASFAAYCAAKAGASKLATDLANIALQKDFKFDFIVNAIEPGSVRTNIGQYDFSGNFTSDGRDFVERSQDADKELLGDKEVSLENIVNAVLYLFFINHAHRGIAIPVDYGLTKTTGGRDLSSD